jgi:hypothetical protein
MFLVVLTATPLEILELLVKGTAVGKGKYRPVVA